MTAEVYLDVVARRDRVISVIRNKMRHLKDVEIVIQDDGAKPHIGKDNLALINAEGAKND